jgi:hypothetical protein
MTPKQPETLIKDFIDILVIKDSKTQAACQRSILEKTGFAR